MTLILSQLHPSQLLTVLSHKAELKKFGKKIFFLIPQKIDHNN